MRNKMQQHSNNMIRLTNKVQQMHRLNSLFMHPHLRQHRHLQHLLQI